MSRKVDRQIGGLIPYGALRAAIILCFASGATNAYAHSAVKGVGDFYAGILHPLTALEHVLSFLSFGVLLGQRGGDGMPLLTFMLSLALGGCLPLLPGVPSIGIEAINIASCVVLGALVASAWPLPVAILHGTAFLLGLSHGFANGEAATFGVRAYMFLPGVVAAGALLAAYGLIATDYLLRLQQKWLQIAIRAAGSWVAAIGILVLATSWRKLTLQ
jgi:urease accessory protein